MSETELKYSYDLFGRGIRIGDKVDIYSLKGKKNIKKSLFRGTKTIKAFGHLGQSPVAWFEEGGSAHSLHAMVKHTGKKIYCCKLRTRKQMDKLFERELLGWWYDVCPGAKLYLQQATKEDLDRCKLNEKASKDPNDYMVEIFDRGALVNKKAIKYVEQDINEMSL